MYWNQKFYLVFASLSKSLTTAPHLVYMYIRRSQIDDLVSPSGFNFENMMHKMVVELGCIL